MEGIVALIIVIVGIIGSLNKSKKVVQNRPGQGNQPPAQPDFKPITPAQKEKKSQPENRAEAPAERTVYRPKPAQAAAPKTAPAAKPARPARPISGPVAAPARPGQSVPPALQDLLQSFIGEEKKPAAPGPADVIPESVSHVDEKGCVGGSLPHDATALHEGEAVKKAHAQTVSVRTDDSENDVPPRANLHVSAEDLRRAVVMAEILGKPKALRPRGERL